MSEYKIIMLRRQPELKNQMAAWFHSNWGIPQQAYLESMDDCLAEQGAVPQWYCAFDGEKVVSFCILDEMGICQGLRIAGPGCVGTVPAYRKKGIGLKMVQNATAILKDRGYDISYIHYTQVGHWYARLGYRTVLRWNCRGILP